MGITDRDEQSAAYKYLANYYLKQDMLNEAYDFAMKCTEFLDVREEAKAMLKDIANKRGMGAEQHSLVLGDQTGAAHSVLAGRLRPPAAHLVLGGGGGLASPGCSPRGSPRRDLEPVNLNFTP